MVDNIGAFRSDFLDVVKREGWGRTSSNEFLGWYAHLTESYLGEMNQHGERLGFPTIAVDPTLFDNDEIWIPTLPHPWNEVLFRTNDIGPSIQGKHVDIFTGEGKEAQKMTEVITSFGNKICLKST